MCASETFGLYAPFNPARGFPNLVIFLPTQRQRGRPHGKELHRYVTFKILANDIEHWYYQTIYVSSKKI